jgi:hypothetical protein
MATNPQPPPNAAGRWWRQPEIQDEVAEEARRIGRWQADQVLPIIRARRSWTRVEVLEVIRGGRERLLMPLSERLWLGIHLIVYEHDHRRDACERADASGELLGHALKEAITEAMRVIDETPDPRLRLARPSRAESLRNALRGRRGPARWSS